MCYCAYTCASIRPQYDNTCLYKRIYTVEPQCVKRKLVYQDKSLENTHIHAKKYIYVSLQYIYMQKYILLTTVTHGCVLVVQKPEKSEKDPKKIYINAPK